MSTTWRAGVLVILIFAGTLELCSTLQQFSFAHVLLAFAIFAGIYVLIKLVLRTVDEQFEK